jgi:hypothetical protein
MRKEQQMNQINVIHPYQYQGQWVFDDLSVGLDKEAFVGGSDDVCDLLLLKVGYDNQPQFTLIFSKDNFPGAQYCFDNIGAPEDGVGRFFHCEELEMTGWLCPALFKYFETAPAHIHVQAKRHEVIFEKLIVGA